MKVAVVLNAGAGSVDVDRCQEQARQIKQAFADVSVAADVYISPGSKLAETARQVAGGADAVVAAGGDGTVSAVAGALAGGQVPLAVMPLGTFNHFAKDIGMPLDLAEAARAIAARRSARLDVGEVNGRIFVNNSSIGLYPEIVIAREQERRQTGRRKLWAMVIAALRVLRRFPLLHVHVMTEQREVVSKTPFVFVGNNGYEISVLALGKRARLDGGQLSLYMVRCRGRLHMFWLMVRALLQRLEAVRDFEFELVSEAHVKLHRRRLEVSFDGEVTTMTSPLHYRIRPGALPVLIPPAKEAVEALPGSVASEEPAA